MHMHVNKYTHHVTVKALVLDSPPSESGPADVTRAMDPLQKDRLYVE